MNQATETTPVLNAMTDLLNSHGFETVLQSLIDACFLQLKSVQDDNNQPNWNRIAVMMDATATILQKQDEAERKYSISKSFFQIPNVPKPKSGLVYIRFQKEEVHYETIQHIIELLKEEFSFVKDGTITFGDHWNKNKFFSLSFSSIKMEDFASHRFVPEINEMIQKIFEFVKDAYKKFHPDSSVKVVLDM